MITYRPLIDTLREKGKTLDDVMNGIGNYRLRERLNAGQGLTFSLLDKMCRYLECEVQDIICFENTDVKKNVKWIRGYEVDWAVVYDLLHSRKSNFHRASLAVGMKGSYFGNVSRNRIASKGVVNKLKKVLKNVELKEYAEPIYVGGELAAEHIVFND